MPNDNAVLRKLNAVGSNACRGALIAAMTVSMLPTSAFAAAATTETGSEATNNAPISATNEETKSLASEYSPSTQTGDDQGSTSSYDLTKIADGTYTGTATADSSDPAASGSEWDVDSYEVKVSVTLASGKITAVKVSDETYNALAGESYDYLEKAENGNKRTTGMAKKIVDSNSADVDTVSGATVSSNAIKTAVDNALQAAYDEQNPSTPVADEYTYGYAGLTWAEYWAAEGVQAAGSTATGAEADSHGESDTGAFDVVTRATANHGLHRGSYQCMATIYTNEGATFELATWATDGGSFTTTDGKTVTWNRGAMTCDGESYTMKDYEVTGLKYVPVKIKTSDLAAFKENHTFVANGETLAGGYGENNLKAYSGLVAAVDADTNGLKTVTNDNGTFTFSAAATGTDSGIEGQQLKTATGIEPAVKDASGSYGEFLRVDLNGDYGDLAASMQSVTWTYYGDDSTYSNALATYGTKFAADNWMHKTNGIQLGLTKSERCQLPEGTNGTGYWKLTVHALGYNDYTYEFQATDDNIVGAKEPVSEATKAKLQELYDKAAALDKSKYTEDSWTASSIETETAETKDLLAKKNLGEAEATEQIGHLQAALDALVSLYPEAGSYVLMNIPYAELYAADTTNNSTKVDVFTSATVSKSQTGRLSGGSYGGLTNVTEADGKKTTEITGAQFPVKVSAEAAEKLDWSKFTQVTDSTTQDVTTTNRGQTSTTTYTGKQALFCMGDYAYYQLSEEPSFYKELTVDDEGNIQLSEVKGTEPTEVSAKATFTTETGYGDYQLDLDDATVSSCFEHETDFIYTVLINAEDENGTQYSYGLRPLENVWLGSKLAWCSTPLVAQVHGCPTSYEHYASLMGKTIKSVTYYTEKGAYTFDIDDTYVPVKSVDASVKAEDASLDSGSATVTATVELPEGFDAKYQIDGQDVAPVENGARTASQVTFDASGLKPGSHTLTAIDANGKFADISGDFTLTTAKLVAGFDAANLKLVATDGTTDEDLANFLGNITKVTVNGTPYAATGRGSVKIFNADGSLNLAAAKQDKSLVFDANGDYQIEVEADGYTTKLGFTYSKSADKTDLEAAIQAAGKLSNDDGTYTAASWKAFEDALAAAQGVNETVAATDDEVATALSDLQTAQAALVKLASIDQKGDLKVEIGRADVLKEADYTADSWKAYQTALAKANEVAADAEASADEVESATSALKAAREALVKAGQSGTGTGTGTGTGAGTNTGNGTATASQDKKSDDQSGLAATGDKQLATVGIFAGIGAAIAAAGVALRRRIQR